MAQRNGPWQPLNQFRLDVQRFVDKANGNVDLVVRKIAADLFTRVIFKSPVDTGRFRANWQVAINSIPAGTLDTTDKAGDATISQVTVAALAMKAGDIIYLVNNLDYARNLEYGHSKQAPYGMVRVTLREYTAVVTKAAGEVPK